MGKKGDKLTNDSVIAAEILLEQLEPIAGVTAKKMFGGHGIFHEGKMFGMVDSKGKNLLKVDDTIQSDFLDKGAEKHGRMPYYTIPQDILDDVTTLRKWAQRSIDISK